jgi:hypothetical protein
MCVVSTEKDNRLECVKCTFAHIPAKAELLFFIKKLSRAALLEFS